MWFPVSFAERYNFPDHGSFLKYSEVFLHAELKTRVLPYLWENNERRKRIHTHIHT